MMALSLIHLFIQTFIISMNILGTRRTYSVPGPALGTGNRDDEVQVSIELALAPGGQPVEAPSWQRAGHALRPPGPQRTGLSGEKKEPWTRLRVLGCPTQGCCISPGPFDPFTQSLPSCQM